LVSKLKPAALPDNQGEIKLAAAPSGCVFDPAQIENFARSR
jgi:hypothetical protein